MLSKLYSNIKKLDCVELEHAVQIENDISWFQVM